MEKELKTFYSVAPVYNQALRNSGFTEEIKFEPKRTKRTNRKERQGEKKDKQKKEDRKTEEEDRLRDRKDRQFTEIIE